MKIGLEIHVQLPTRSKMFCSCPTEGDDIPNSRVCPTCLGMPGSKPVLNRKALELGLTLAKMLGCTIPERTWFSRKTYFYPDLCKHFQITQYDTPIGEKGSFRVGDKTIRITRVHLEEDPGKTKRVGDGTALVDYNRSGIPLVEIVTEPDLSSPAEARQFLSELLAAIRDRYPKAHAALMELYSRSTMNRRWYEYRVVHRFIRCNLGEYDQYRLDINHRGQLQLEEVHCPLRGECRHEGVICKPQLDTRLTERELEVFRLIAQHLTAEDIAEELCISPCTVARHRENIKAKIGARSVAEMVEYWLRNGLK